MKHGFNGHKCEVWWDQEMQCPFGPYSEFKKKRREKDEPPEERARKPVPVGVPPAKGKTTRALEDRSFMPEPDVAPAPLPAIPGVPPPPWGVPPARVPDEEEEPARVPVPQLGGARAWASMSESWQREVGDPQWARIGRTGETEFDIDERPRSGGKPSRLAHYSVATNLASQAEKLYARRLAESATRSSKRADAREESGSSSSGARSRRRRTARDRGDAARVWGRVGRAAAIAIGTAYTISRMTRGGRGGGFHRPAATFRPNDRALRTY